MVLILKWLCSLVFSDITVLNNILLLITQSHLSITKSALLFNTSIHIRSRTGATHTFITEALHIYELCCVSVNGT